MKHFKLHLDLLKYLIALKAMNYIIKNNLTILSYYDNIQLI